MLESEAQTKWCPFVSLIFVSPHSGNPSGGNRIVTSTDGYEKVNKCLGRGCMAWRTQQSSPDAPSGYCGMAGKD